MRGRITSFVAAHDKHSQKSYVAASNRLRKAQQDLNASPTDKNRQAWEEAKREFDRWALAKEIRYERNVALTYHKFGNKAGALLARMSKGTRPQAFIPHQKTKQGQIVTSPREMVQVLEEYYRELYTLQETADSEMLEKNYLGRIDLSRLTEEMLDTLNNPITEA